jgi:hypothetical protein
MLNFIPDSINYFERHFLSFFMGLIGLLFISFFVSIKAEGKKITM